MEWQKDAREPLSSMWVSSMVSGIPSRNNQGACYRRWFVGRLHSLAGTDNRDYRSASPASSGSSGSSLCFFQCRMGCDSDPD
jgi:hypothetical protein